MSWGKWLSIISQYVNTFRVSVMNRAGQKKLYVTHCASWFWKVSILQVLMCFCKNLHWPPGCLSIKATESGIYVFKKVMLRIVATRSHLENLLICVIWSVTIWPQTGQIIDYLNLKINFLDSEFVSVYLNFALSDGIVVQGILRTEKLKGI